MVLLISNICTSPVCVYVCVYHLTFECDLGSSTFARLGVSISYMQSHTSGWQATNVPLIPTSAVLPTAISNFSLDHRFVMAAEMLSTPSGQC